MTKVQAATSGWRAGALVGALLTAIFLARPAAAATASKNTNVTATAKYSASSEWDSAAGDVTYLAGRAFDGDLTTRWNVDRGSDNQEGSWLEADWDAPVTVNRVVVREAFDRFNAIRIQSRDAGSTTWKDVDFLEGDRFALAKTLNPDTLYPIFSLRFPQPIQTAGLRVVFEQTTSSPSILEVEAWNNPSGTVTGTVTDPAGKPVAGAVIRAGEDYAVSGADGKYTLTADAGTYTVQAGKFGAFRSRTARGVAVAAGANVTQDFTVLPEPANLSLTATAVSSSDYSDDYNADKAKDGKLTTRWNASGEPTGATLDMQWDQPQTFNRIIIREAFDRIRNYTLQKYDEASDTYSTILSGSIPDRSSGGDRNAIHPVVTHILPTPVTSKRLRLLVDQTQGGDPSIWELEVANAPVATVTGVVTDVASGNPIANATITDDQGQVLGTSDTTGKFSLVVEPNEYFVNASAEGYFTGLPVTFNIDAGQTLPVTLALPAKGPNIALKGKASASSEDPSYPASMVNDGDLTTYWLASDPADQSVAITWDQPTHFTAVQLRGFQGNLQASAVQYLDADGKTWKDVANFTPQFLGKKLPDFLIPEGVTSTSVRFFVSRSDDINAPPGLAEFQVYDAPLPKPAP